MNPKVSVSIITYNHGQWLAECLESIVTQRTTFPFEIIVGDDASTDGVSRPILVDYARRYPEMVKPVLRDQNIGGTANYFDVTARCQGDYIACIDGDDRMLPGKLQKQAEFLDTHLECSIVAHDLRVFDSKTNATIRSTFNSEPIPPIADINYLVLKGCYFGNPSKMYRKTAIITTHRNDGGVDFHLHLEHASKGKIGYLDEVLGEYRKSPNSHSNPSNPIHSQIIHSHLDAYQKALELGCEPEAVYRGRTTFKYAHAMEMLDLDRYDEFKALIKIDAPERRYAMWRHRVIARMTYFPSVVRWVPKLFRFIKKVIGRE